MLLRRQPTSRETKGLGWVGVRLSKSHLKWFISSRQALLTEVLYYPHPGNATSWDQDSTHELTEDILYLNVWKSMCWKRERCPGVENKPGTAAGQD